MKSTSFWPKPPSSRPPENPRDSKPRTNSTPRRSILNGWVKHLGILAITLGCIAVPRSAERAISSRLLFEENFEAGLKGTWKPIKFSGLTEYRVQAEGTNKVLQALAKGTASGLGIELNLPAKGHYKLQWRWKIDQVVPGASETQIKKFDHAARVFIAFKSGIGPAKTLNYAWSSSEKVGHVFQHPSSGRSRFLVLQSGNAQAGKWITETRDLAADWKLLFGEATLPELAGIGIITDSDGAGTEAIAYYDDFKLVRE